MDQAVAQVPQSTEGQAQTQGGSSKNGWVLLPLQIFIGLVIILFNAPGFYRYIANHNVPYEPVADLLRSLADLPDKLYTMFGASHEELFIVTFSYCLYGVGIYMVGVALLALRKGKWQLFILAPLFLLFGAYFAPLLLRGYDLGRYGLVYFLMFSLWVMSYRALILLSALMFVIAALVIGIIIVLLRRFKGLAVIGLATLGITIWFLIPYLHIAARVVLVGVGLAVVGALLYAIYKRFSWWGLLTFFVVTPLLWFARTYLMVVMEWLFVALMWAGRMLGTIFMYIGRFFTWLGQYFVWLVEIIAFISMLILGFLYYMFFTLIGLGLLATLGNFLIDDIIAAWRGGTGVKGATQATFGVGLSLSLVMLASTGSIMAQRLVDIAWWQVLPNFYDFSLMASYMLVIPERLEPFLETSFGTAGIPLFDVALVGAVLLVAYLGIIRGFQSGTDAQDEYSVTFFSVEGFWLIIGPILAVIAVIALNNFPSEESE